MYALILLTLSQHIFKHQPQYAERLKWNNLFSIGARWMHERLCEMRGSDQEFDEVINFTYYGVLKYSISIAGLVIALYYLIKVNIFLAPLAILFFYFLEVHFLFLFPLLIDKVKRPLLNSIRLAYKIGIIRAVFNVLPIAIFMLLGLFNYKKPLYNWYIGCLAILYWYHYEVEGIIFKNL
ncbi:MAG: hypothetical protein SFU99_23280 [Saprospiraceae bacterium]|nr:hypothetical protein [Saprospiraceae bacterium]